MKIEEYIVARINELNKEYQELRCDESREDVINEVVREFQSALKVVGYKAVFSPLEGFILQEIK